MRYTIIEPRSSGHLLVYVRVLCERAISLGHHVTVASTRSAAESEEWGSIASMKDVSLKLFEFEPRKYLDIVLSLAVSTQADVVVVPHGDEVAAQLGALISRPPLPCALHLLVMRDPTWERDGSVSARLRALLKSALLARADRTRRCELIWLREAGAAPEHGKRHAHDPYIGTRDIDLVRSRASELRDEIGMDALHEWCVVTGAITDRKNLPLIIAAASKARHRRANLALAVIGPIRTSAPVDVAYIRAASQRAGLPCVVLDRLLTNDEMNNAVAAADVVVMAYSSTAPNSTLVKAAVLGSRLVAAGPTTVQEFARRLGAIATSPLNEEALAASLLQALDAEPPPPRPALGSSTTFADQVLLPGKRS